MRDHLAHADGRGGRQLLLALLVNLVIMAAEIVGGALSGSLALLTDAGHMLVDVTALAIGLVAARLSIRKPTTRMTFGYRRTEILAALTNSIILIGLLVFIITRAVERLVHPQPVAAGLMAWVAGVGLAGNIISLIIIRKHRDATHNVRAAFLHVLSDLLSSVGVFLAGVLIACTGWYVLDSLASFFVAMLILRLVWVVLRDTVTILLDATPTGIETETVRRAIMTIPGVRGVHDLHITTHTSHMYVGTLHILVAASTSLAEVFRIITDVRTLLRERFRIWHVTIEPEELPPRPISSHCTVCEFQQEA